jgi:hypothetical protein
MTSGSLKMQLPNGEMIDGVNLTPEGNVIIMCADGVRRQVHPVVVEAFAKSMVPTGIWIAALAKRNSTDPLVRRMGKEMDFKQ